MSVYGQIIAGGGGFNQGWDAEQQRQNAMRIQQLQVQEQQRNAQAMAALGKYLQANGQPGAPQPPMGGPPQGMPQGMPQQAPQPMPQPTLQQRAQGGAPVTPPIQGGQPSGPMGGGGQPMRAPGGGGAGVGAPAQPAGGGMDLQTLATRIKQANPDIDDPTLFQAVTQMSGLLSAQGVSQLKAASVYWAHEDRLAQLQERADAARMRSEDMKLSIQERQAAAAEANQTRVLIANLSQQGQSDRQQKSLDAKKSLTEEVQDRIDARAQKSIAAKGANAQSKAAMTQATTQYKALVAQRQDVDGQISEARFEISNGVGDMKAAQQKLQTLQSQRTAINNKIVANWQSAKTLGLDLPSPSDLLGGTAQGDAGASAAAGAAKPATGGGSASSGAAPTKYTIGQTIDAGGKKYRVVGGDLNGDPDVEPIE